MRCDERDGRDGRGSRRLLSIVYAEVIVQYDRCHPRATVQVRICGEGNAVRLASWEEDAVKKSMVSRSLGTLANITPIIRSFALRVRRMSVVVVTTALHGHKRL